MDLNELQNEAHMMALQRSFSSDALKIEASKHSPMTCMGVWFCSTIVRELFEKYYPQWKDVHNNPPPYYTPVLARSTDWKYFILEYTQNGRWVWLPSSSIVITHWMEIIF